MRGIHLVIACALTAILLAGCTDGGDPDPTDSPGPGTSAPDTSPTPTPDSSPTGSASPAAMRDPVTWNVEVRDNSFSPNELTIQVGDTVVWTQTGQNAHTVTASDESFDSHPECEEFAHGALGRCMSNGATFEHTFESVGEVDYRCKVHDAMTGTITVLERYDETP